MSPTPNVDPVTFEIVRHKLLNVMDEAIIALENVSGSPITNEGHDLMVSLYKADGGPDGRRRRFPPPPDERRAGGQAHHRDVRRRSGHRRGRRLLLQRLIHGGAPPTRRVSDLADSPRGRAHRFRRQLRARDGHRRHRPWRVLSPTRATTSRRGSRPRA